MPEKYLIMAIIMVIGGLIVAACFVIYAVMRLERKIEDTFFDAITSITMYKANMIAKGSKIEESIHKVHDQILNLQNSFEFRSAHNENKFSETDDKIYTIENRIDDIENKLHYTVNSTAFSSMDQLLESREENDV